MTRAATRFDSTVAAFVAACRAEVLSERTIEFYLEGLNAIVPSPVPTIAT